MAHTPIQLSAGEKLILLMLADIQKRVGIGGDIDGAGISAAIVGGHMWALDWEYGDLLGDEVDRATVNYVTDVLDMWSFLETRVAKLVGAERAELEKRIGSRSMQLLGFDGNDESADHAVAVHMTRVMGRFGQFKHRDLNSHMPTREIHRRMLDVFRPLRPLLGDRGLTIDELADILMARR